MKKHASTRLALIPAAALMALLAACGGGGDSGSTPATGVTDTQAQAMSVNSAVVPSETTDAATALLSTTQAVVAGGTASQTFTISADPTGAAFTTNGYHAAFLEILARCRKPCIAHGVGLSLGTTGAGALGRTTSSFFAGACFASGSGSPVGSGAPPQATSAAHTTCPKRQVRAIIRPPIAGSARAAG